MEFYTSDTHFGHARIIELCDRPFKNVDHMNDEIVNRWNSVVGPDDVVYHLGDVALGPIDQSLAQVGRLNGHKILINGNHDRPFMKRGKPAQAEWVKRYAEVFQEIILGNMAQLLADGTGVNLSHFPYDGDSHGGDRYAEARIPDFEGQRPLVHGHTHLNTVMSRSVMGSIQIHVGMDAHDFTPVSEEQVINYINIAKEQA